MPDLTRSPDFLLSRLLHRDGLMLIVDKPAGLPCHRGPSGGECLEDYFDALRFGLPRPPALAHRLDRDTSGCLILGRHPKALRKLGKLFQEGRIEKTYLAVCRGAPPAASGSVDLAIDKVATRTGWRMAPTPDGKPAVTTYRVIRRLGDVSVIEARPKTGRTHQIRVHLAAIGAPILGDPQYGDLSAEDRRREMLLHALRVVAPVSASHGPVAAEAPPPPAFYEFLERG